MKFVFLILAITFTSSCASSARVTKLGHDMSRVEAQRKRMSVLKVHPDPRVPLNSVPELKARKCSDSILK